MNQIGSNAWDQKLISLGRVLRTLREEENLDILISTTLDYIRDTFDHQLIWIALYDRPNHRLVGKGGVTPAGEIKFLKERFALEPGDLLDQVIVMKKAIPIADLRQEKRSGEWQKLAIKFDIQGTLLFPIYHKDISCGLVLLGSRLWNVSSRADERARLSVLLGTLGSTLYRLETDFHDQQVKRPDEPLLLLLDRLRSLNSLNERLEEVVQKTHNFIMPTRTHVYWFEREHQYFWRRTVNKQKNLSATNRHENTSGITVQDAPDLYKALAKDQLVMVIDARNMTKGEISTRVMEQFGAVSLVAAPIIFQSELIGFLCVENDEARLWSEIEKNYLRGAAQLIALTAPLEEMESMVQRIASDQILTAGIAKAIYTDSDWQESLQMAAEQLCQRLNVERFWIVLHNRGTGAFEIYFQYHPQNRRPMPKSFEELSAVDFHMMEKAAETIAIENFETDYRFVSWRSSLMDLEMRSLLLSSTAVGKPLESILAVGHETARTWSRPEREIVQAVAQQVGLIIHQGHLQRQTDDRQKLHQAVQFGLVTLQQANSLENLHPAAAQLLAQVMQAPLSVLLTWLPGRVGGQIAASFASHEDFRLNINETLLPIESDPLMQWAVQTEGILPLSIHDLQPPTLQWLNAKGIGQILVIALRTTPEHQPTGMLLVADKPGRRWLDRQLQAFSMLTNQLAWSRRHLVIVETLQHQRTELERLNWYKQRRIEDIYRSVGSGVQRLLELESRTDGNDAVGNLRLQYSLQQLQASISPLPQIIRKEQWRLRPNFETAPLAGLLKRSLERVDAIIKQRQMWSQVHNQASVIIAGDIAKIEMIIHELLLFACGRSEVRGRVDIWCRQIDERSLEVSITDNGEIDPNLLMEMHEGRSPDILLPSVLDQPPGLHLAICQSLMHEAGGDLSIYKLEDNRILSRLILPLSVN
jgi:GAF domain-containing protein